MINDSDIVLPYKLKISGSRRLINIVFCVLVTAGAWCGALALHRYNASPQRAPEEIKSFELVLLLALAIFSTPLTLLQIYASIQHLRSSGRILLTEREIVFPVGVSMRDVTLPYSKITKIEKKALRTNAITEQTIGTWSVLQLFHAGGKKVIMIQALPSPADAELIIQTWESRRSISN